ncbi:MAG: hypothetical protein KDC95_21060 [Planctomycetes bacterium]|nr:hypothetical protein [Planctomycetota bacterium]
MTSKHEAAALRAIQAAHREFPDLHLDTSDEDLSLVDNDRHAVVRLRRGTDAYFGSGPPQALRIMAKALTSERLHAQSVSPLRFLTVFVAIVALNAALMAETRRSSLDVSASFHLVLGASYLFALLMPLVANAGTFVTAWASLFGTVAANVAYAALTQHSVNLWPLSLAALVIFQFVPSAALSWIVRTVRFRVVRNSILHRWCQPSEQRPVTID